MKVEKVTGNVGAEISGLDLAACDDSQIWRDLYEVLLENAVIFFRDQQLSVERYLHFARQFGELFENNSPVIRTMAGHPELEIIRKEADAISNVGDEWHTDQSHRPNPCMGTMLYAIEVPPYGGDTLFANTAAAYESLPDDLAEAVQGLEAVHSPEYLLRQTAQRTGDPDKLFGSSRATSPPAAHPVVRIHPDTGRRVLYVNPAYTEHFVGQTPEQSRPLLQRLFAHVLRPEHFCRFRWRKGSLAFWDNRQTWHYAVNDYHGYRREMRRLIVREPAPELLKQAV